MINKILGAVVAGVSLFVIVIVGVGSLMTSGTTTETVMHNGEAVEIEVTDEIKLARWQKARAQSKLDAMKKRQESAAPAGPTYAEKVEKQWDDYEEAIKKAEKEKAEKLAADRKENAKRGIVALKKRVAAGSVAAKYSLAVRYLEGNGVDVDREKGLSMLKECAEAGSAMAEKRLALERENKKPADPVTNGPK